jgi:hypothetical protein
MLPAKENEVNTIAGKPVLWWATCPKCRRAYQRGITQLAVNCQCGMVFTITIGGVNND